MTTIDATVSTRERIIQAAIDLLATGGREAVSTRAVSAAAGVQPPTIYRQFGDMQGLLDTVAARGFAMYIESKVRREPESDPVDDLRAGWDLHIAFGLANPAIYGLLYGNPRPDAQPPAAREAAVLLRALVQRVAAAGRLRVEADRAAAISHAAGIGVTLSLLALRPEDRDPHLSEMTREAVLAAITTDEPIGAAGAETSGSRLTALSVALTAVLADGQGDRLTPAEHGLLLEWLDRLSEPSS